jgi:putative endonuclease
MDSRKKTGWQGEEIAAAYLIENGYEIIARNWRCALGELDVIVHKDDVLVFVEVRTRRGQRFGSAEESITPAKQTRLIELAQTYWAELQPDFPSWRIDVITVRLGRGLPHINHIENAVGW